MVRPCCSWNAYRTPASCGQPSYRLFPTATRRNVGETGGQRRDAGATLAAQWLVTQSPFAPREIRRDPAPGRSNSVDVLGDLPVNILIVRPATTDEIEFRRWGEETLAQERAMKLD